ncbi:MAG: hypothetical protein AB1716_14085 [Planctomycetota bacterium]
MRTRLCCATIVGALAVRSVSTASGQIPRPMEWSPEFDIPTISNYRAVFDFALWDDGHGPELFATGWFDRLGSVPANGIAAWNGRTWRPLGTGLNATEGEAVAVYDDGTGPALYVGGSFLSAGGVSARRIARWDGTAWSGVGGGIGGSSIYTATVYDLLVFDDGRGPALFAAGIFNTAGGAPANNVARWDGRTWSSLGAGLTGSGLVYAYPMCAFDDGHGPALHVGGLFTHAGGMPASSIARWDGSAWSEVGGGVSGGHYPAVYALATFDDGLGQALYVGGFFENAGSVPARFLAGWNGATWSALGTGPDGPVETLRGVEELDGPALYVGGRFEAAGGVASPGVAKWKDGQWRDVGGGLHGRPPGSDVFAMTEADIGHGRKLFISTVWRSAVRTWDGARWGEIGHGFDQISFGQQLCALATHDDGRGPALYVAGNSGIKWAGAGPFRGIARWHGDGWESVGGGFDPNSGCGYALASFDGGAGPELILGGTFGRIGGITANNIARWNGTAWAALGGGIDGQVLALRVFDDGHGAALYAGGSFTTAGGLPAANIARWDGVNWSEVGGGVSGEYNAQVEALEVHDDGSGPALYAAGRFALAGGRPAYRVARWDGWAWFPVGAGVPTHFQPHALAVYDDGAGRALYVGGAPYYPQGELYRWDGQAWVMAVGKVVYDYGYSHVYAFSVWDDGRGPALYAAGDWSYFGLGPLARWDGRRWTWLRSGRLPNYQGGRAVHPVQNASGTALFVAGSFTKVGNTPSFGIARWQAVPGGLSGDLNCDGAIDLSDINPFVLALSDAAGYAARYPDCLQINADCDGNGLVDFNDITPFVELLE